MAEGTLRIRAVADTRQLQRAMKGVRGQMDSLGRKSMRAGKTLSMGLTAPLVGAGVMALKTAGNFEKSMNRVKAVSGATGKDFQQLSDLARELGSTTQFSASQAAEAMGFLAQAGFKTDDMMAALPGTLDLAAAGQLELAEAADIASNVLTGFGMKAEDIGRVNDVLAATASNANTDVRQMGEAFSLVAPVAKSSGMEIEETSAIIGMLGDAGIQASRAGTTLRGMIAALESPSAAAASAIEDLGLRTHDAQGELLPMTDIVSQLEESGLSSADAMEIFGRRAGPGMAALVSQGSDRLDSLTGKLEESGGTAKRMADTQMEGLNGALLRLKSALEGAAIAIAESGLLDNVASFAEKLAGLFQRLSEANPKLLKIGVIVAALAAAIGPLLVVFGALSVAVAAITAPVAVVVTAIAGLTAAFVTAYTKSEKFRDIVNGAFDAVKNVVGPTIGWLGDRLGDIGDFFGITRKTVADEAAEMSNKAVGEAVEMVTGMTDELRQLSLDGETLSQETADKFVANVREMRDKAIAAAEEQSLEQTRIIREMADELDTISGEQAREMIANEREKRDQTIAANEMMAERVERITRKMQEASGEEHEKLQERAVTAMNAQQTEVVKALSKQETESTNVLSRLRAESDKISLEMASEAIKQSAKQRDKTIAAANTEFEDRVAAINKMERESETFTREMADEAIAEARKQRDETISSADEMHTETVKEIKGMRNGVEREVDTATGNMLSTWEKFWRDWGKETDSGFSGFLIDSAKWLVSWDQDSSKSIGGTLSRWTTKFSTWFSDSLTSLGEWTSDMRTKMSIVMEAAGTIIKNKIDKIVDWFGDLPERITKKLTGLGAKIAGKFSIDLPGVTLGGQGDGPGFGVPSAGGSATQRAQAAMEGLPVYVTSTYRTPEQNRAAGGSETSYHLDKSNPATDIGGPTWALNIVAARLRAMNKNRELLWQVAGHYDHVHVAHDGGTVTPNGIQPLKADEIATKLQVGETVFPRGAGQMRAGGGSVPPLVIQIDGREVARLTAAEMEEQLARRERQGG